MDTLQISERELAQFEQAISIACLTKSDKRLERQASTRLVRAPPLPSCCSTAEGSLVIAFDRSWFPFLCNTDGAGAGRTRWYIPKASRLIAAIARALQSPMQRAVGYVAGGEIVLDAGGGRRCPEGRAEIAVLTWRLPRASTLLPPRLAPGGA
jgi:hypothetical protein